jgi:hypothetical protein
MKTLLIAIALLMPSFAFAQDPLEIDESTVVADQVSAKPPAKLSQSMDDYELSRVVDDLMERVTILEETQLDEGDVELIAEKVYKRMTIVVNKAEGGQELRTVEAKLSDGSILKTTLEPGQTFATAIDPFTGQVVTLGNPTMVKVPAYREPVKQWEFDSFRVRQSPPLPTGQTIVGIQLNDQCFIDESGKKVCPQFAAVPQPTRQYFRPTRQTTTIRATTTNRPRLFSGRR